MPLEFDFSTSPIPLDATDLYLQVAYRGPIGPDAQSAEQDVVLVATKDISEPTYFSYFNASDYVHIGAKVYTRQAVEGDQSLLAAVRPTGCVAGTFPNQQLVADCLTPFDLTIKFSFADLNNPAITAFKLPTRRFLRFAFLVDPPPLPSIGQTAKTAQIPKLNIRVVDGSVSDGAADAMVDKALLYQRSICLPLDPIDITPVRNQLQFEYAAPAFVDSSRSLSTLRGIYGYTQVACVVNADDSAPGADDDRNINMSRLDASQGETQPFPVIVNPTFLAP